MSRPSTKELLQHHGLAPKKRFGQNFLVNRHTAESIVSCAEISPEETIIEVGTGLGALTNSIADRARMVIGIEIDRGIISYHRHENVLKENVTLIHGDILKTDFRELSRQYGAQLKIIANLPYSISNPFIFKLIENRQLMSTVVVMLQKEVAERLTAPPATKQYGIPTVLLNRFATIRNIMTVGPEQFHPRPKIESQVIRIDFLPTADEHTGQDHFDLFQKVVRGSFAKRRKTLLNNLASLSLARKKDGELIDRQRLCMAITDADVSPSERAENLSVDDFRRLTTAIEKVILS